MPEIKTIVCLANSRKLSGRCVAGVELVDGEPVGWVRPVSHRATHEVSETEREYRDGSDPRLLDIIDVPLLGPSPHGFQTENWLLDPHRYWERRGRAEWSTLGGMLCREMPLWIDGESSYNGVNDRVPERAALGLTDSLRLVHVASATLRVMEGYQGRREVRAIFDHAGVAYALKVTDPEIEREAKSHETGDYSIAESALTISLGETFEGYAYKLVAAIIRRR